MNPNLFIFLSFAVVSFFSFVSIAAWTGTRHQERKDFYRAEMLKKLAESGSAAVLEYLREEEKQDERRRAEERERSIEGNRLVGLVLMVVGGLAAVALHEIVRELPVYLFGFIPAGIGVVFLLMSLTSRRDAKHLLK